MAGRRRAGLCRLARDELGKPSLLEGQLNDFHAVVGILWFYELGAVVGAIRDTAATVFARPDAVYLKAAA